MIILPTADAPDGAARASTLITQVATQRRAVSMFVFGDDDIGREAASRADVRAENNPFRQVVWVPDRSVLASCAAAAALVPIAKASRAVSLTLDFTPSKQLSDATAVDFFELEQAFNAAEAGE